jgi:hypothetical protein
MRKIFNASNVLGTTGFICMILAVGAVEGGSYIAGVALIVAFAVCMKLAVKEDGQKKRPR